MATARNIRIRFFKTNSNYLISRYIQAYFVSISLLFNNICFVLIYYLVIS